MFSSTLLFFEFSAPEIMLILFVTLLLFGGDKLPGLARGLGKGIRDFKDASEGVKREITSQIDNYEKKKEDTAVKPSTEETPLIAEHSLDNADATAAENAATTIHESPVANTVPLNESHVTATDHVEWVAPADYVNPEDPYHVPVEHVTEPAKEQTNK